MAAEEVVDSLGRRFPVFFAQHPASENPGRCDVGHRFRAFADSLDLAAPGADRLFSRYSLVAHHPSDRLAVAVRRATVANKFVLAFLRGSHRSVVRPVIQAAIVLVLNQDHLRSEFVEPFPFNLHNPPPALRMKDRDSGAV